MRRRPDVNRGAYALWKIGRRWYGKVDRAARKTAELDDVITKDDELVTLRILDPLGRMAEVSG